jgi:hypothetical protein
MAPLPSRAHEAFGIVGIGRQIGVVGIAVGEMAEGREDVIAIVPPHGADDVARAARRRVEAFHEARLPSPAARSRVWKLLRAWEGCS